MRKDKILSCTVYLIHVLIILDLFLTEVASVTLPMQLAKPLLKELFKFQEIFLPKEKKKHKSLHNRSITIEVSLCRIFFTGNFIKTGEFCPLY